MTERVAKAEASVLKTLRENANDLSSTALITSLLRGDVPYSEADIVEAIWRLEQKGQIEISPEGRLHELAVA